ncbi:MAG: 6-pyruvoyl tetrahydropterin synthase family protein [Planctomycetales bacterium]|nr:6-pyruvoyl tetrahydropterin synthase family protein [Planctomycetales bacterium]
MAEKYHVRLAKEHFVFSAAHFITFGNNVCERLHGHNYRVEAQLHGPLDDNQYVIDFIQVRDTLAEITRQLDHHVLLPTGHPTIHVACIDDEVTATFEDRRWVFPRGDCVLLPVENTTAELLARHIGLSLLEALREQGAARPQRACVSVDECNGQLGVWSWDAE